MLNRLAVVVISIVSLINSSLAATTTTGTTTSAPTTRVVAKPKLPPKAPMSMGLPTAPTTLPFGLGVNIHFTNPKADEMDQLAAAGFTFVRMDFSWGDTEKTRGTYNFSAYETLLDALAPYGIRALFILDYSNPLYDDNLSPHTDEGRAAFAKWAAAGVAHFKGRGILWEIYNEPNGFWRPSPNTGDYIKLALETAKAIKSAAPDDTYIGPAVAGMDFGVLEACFKAGLLDYWDAVTVHPYRQGPPESVAGDYRKLRQLIARYAPKGKSIRIYSGEWGYSSAWSGYDEDKQGHMLPRQWLTNLCNDVPVSIWYDWHDDGTDTKEPEHHFGTVRYFYSNKPAYLAAKTLTEQLAGYQFNKRLALASEDDFLLLFRKGDEEVKLVAWSAAREPHTVVVPTLTGTFDVAQHTGQAAASITAENAGLPIVLGPGVQYLTPVKMTDALRRGADAERAPLEVVVTAPAQAMGRMLSRGQESVTVEVPMNPTGPTLSQRTVLLVANPLRMSISPPEPGGLPVRIENPSGERFFGTLRLRHAAGLSTIVNLPAGQTEMTVTLPLPPGVGDLRAAAELIDDTGKTVVATPPTRFVPIDIAAAEKFDVRAEGDAKVSSTQSLAPGGPGGEAARAGSSALKLTYRFDAGWKYLCVFPKDAALAKIEGQPKSLGMWLGGDGAGDTIRMRFTDSTGQTFQPDGPRLDSREWRYVVFPLSSTVGHWGGAADGVIHYPIKFDALFLIDSNHAAHAGEVTVAAPILAYEESPAPASMPTTKP